MTDWERGTETVRPVFVDNRDGNTLARAITTHLAALRREGQSPAELCVASCYFNPQGLELIASEVQHVPRIRLLLGADPTPEPFLPRRTPYDPPEPEFTRRRVGQALVQLERGLRQDRDLLPFDLELDRGTYPKGQHVSAQMAMLKLVPHRFHGDWNYTIHPMR